MRILLAGIVLVALQGADAKTPAVPKEPPAAAVSHADKICTASGGFGRRFGRGYGHVDATAGDDWAPFAKLTVEGGHISAEASFHGARDSEEDDAAAAEHFFKALDHAVEAKHKFAHREASGGGSIVFHTAKEQGTGLVFEISLRGDTVVAACSDLGG